MSVFSRLLCFFLYQSVSIMTTSSFEYQSNIIIVPEGVSSRIDSRLSEYIWYSRHFIQHIISRGGILVQNRTIKKSYTLRTWDIINIDTLERFIDGWIMQEAKRIPLDISKETEDYLVLRKPAWVISHPTSIRDLQTPSVVAFLVNRYDNLPTQWHFMRAGLLHRLDQATQWRMIAAKTEQWLRYFKQLFQEKSLLPTIQEKQKVWLIKWYRAVCRPSKTWRIWLDSLVLPYHLVEPVIPRVPHPVIKEGITTIIDYKDLNSTDVSITVELLTWRTHQIRYHLSHHGCPIIGDYIYDWLANTSLHLTAYKLAFIDMNNQWQIFEV